MGMSEYKRIEKCIAGYIARNYKRAAEIGIGENPDAALLIRQAGVAVFCTDVKPVPRVPGLTICRDDVFSPDFPLYRGCDLVYAIRPAEEMIPAMISLAREIGCDLLVYHLGFECYGTGGERIDCGVVLHKYHSV
jgi:hypothetical protein